MKKIIILLLLVILISGCESSYQDCKNDCRDICFEDSDCEGFVKCWSDEYYKPCEKKCYNECKGIK